MDERDGLDVCRRRVKVDGDGADDHGVMTINRRLPLRSVIISGATLLVALAVWPAAPAHSQQPSGLTFELNVANEGWIDTGIVLGENEEARLTVTGEAFWEPGFGVGPAGAPGAACDLYVPSGLTGALLARVGAGVPVPGDGSVALTGPGRVSLIYNDCPSKYFDNSGSYQISFAIGPLVSSRLPLAAPAASATVEPEQPSVTEEPAPAAVVESDEGKGSSLPFALLLPLLVVVGIGVVAWQALSRLGVVLPLIGRLPSGPALRQSNVEPFHPLARLESSAWLAPMRLGLIQGEKRPKKFLTVGGPDADIDFGVPGVWARLYPTHDGGVRIEKTTTADRIVVDGVPLVLSQRLKAGAQVQMGTRSFVYRGDKEDGPRVTAFGRYTSELSRPDPRGAGDELGHADARLRRESYRSAVVLPHVEPSAIAPERAGADIEHPQAS